MQQAAARALYVMRAAAYATGDKLARDWQRLTTSDHLYYMCTKWFADGDVHKYFRPYESPYEAYIAFMNTLNDLAVRTGAGESASSIGEEPHLRQASRAPTGPSHGRHTWKSADPAPTTSRV